MTASEKLIAFIRNTFDTALYFAVMAVKENFRNYIRRAGPTGDPSRGMVILGNGPSLAEDLPRLIARREYEARDFMAVNFFCRGRPLRGGQAGLLRPFRPDVLPRQRVPRPRGRALPHAR